MSYQIITDVAADIPQTLYESWGLAVARMPLTIDGNTTFPDSHQETVAMYQAMRAGAAPVTAAVSPEGWQQVMTPILEKGDDLLVLAFSSGLSATYSCAELARQELAEQYPDRKIRVVDTLCASMGQGLLVYYACRHRDAGESLDQVADWCEENKLHIAHWFTVEDLKYLRRGGRISAATAIAGTLLNIKPVLHVADDGKLYSVAKARGRKASLAALAEKLKNTSLENDTVFISHGDCLEDAQLLKEMIGDKFQTVLIGEIGSLIGAHSGPGTMALFFLDSKR